MTIDEALYQIKQRIKMHELKDTTNIVNEREKALLDYITNLQEENNELKQIIDIRECQLEEMQMNKTDYTQVNILEMQLEDYKQRIDKAIKKIEKDAELIDLEDGYNTCMAVIDILRGDE